MLRPALWILAVTCLAGPAAAGPLLLQFPAVSRTHLAFGYADDVWVAPRTGGEARRLSPHPRGGSYPVFSPDGATIAFARQTGGNWDVYAVPLAGGEPLRLTHHPAVDVPMGWTPDGKRVLFFSMRESMRERSALPDPRLFTIPVTGGIPGRLPFPQGWAGSFSPDGRSIAIAPLPNLPRLVSFGRYRGGAVSRIWIGALADSSIREVPHGRWNDSDPMWVGESVYFLSDRSGTTNLYRYGVRSGKTRRLTAFREDDVESAAACADAIVFVRGGSLHLYDLETARIRPVPVRIPGEFPELRPRTVRAAPHVRGFQLSSDGNTAFVGARGEILRVDTGTQEAQNLTGTPGVAERSPALSPDGKWLAYFSDAGGEYELHVRPAAGGPPRAISIEAHPTFYRELTWAPDGRTLAFSDDQLHLWLADVDRRSCTKIVDGTYGFGNASFHPAWSPDSAWLAYSMFRPNYLRQVFLYSRKQRTSIPVTDGRMDSFGPVFDRSGERLYFRAASNLGLNLLGTSRFPYERSVEWSVHAAVLGRESAPVPGDPPGRAAIRTVVDPVGLGQRISRLFNVREEPQLAAGEPGVLIVLAGGMLSRWGPAPRPLQTLQQGVGGVRVLADGALLAYRRGSEWRIQVPGAEEKPAERVLDLERLRVEVDPRAEWGQIFAETCRAARDYFFDPGLHGQDLAALRRKYAAYLPGIVTRGDLNRLLRGLLANLSVSHLQVSGGDIRGAGGGGENTGLLGADFELHAGRWRFARICRRARPNERSTGPLAASGVREGEYLLEVDSRPLTGDDSLYQRMSGKAGQIARLRVGPRPDGSGSRTIEVRPIGDETPLRYLEWVETRRETVERLTGGRLGYIHLPDTGYTGAAVFNREFPALIDREGLVLDGRYNSGGEPADTVVEALARRPLSAYAFRAGADMPFPIAQIRGPKIMLINEAAGSGGDTLPWMFRQAKIGLLVGRRTMGAGIGNWVSAPELVDGGTVQLPNRAFFDPHRGRWAIENAGVSPDVDVQNLPADWRAGRDRQLERAVSLALSQLEKPRRPLLRRPLSTEGRQK